MGRIAPGIGGTTDSPQHEGGQDLGRCLPLNNPD